MLLLTALVTAPLGVMQRHISNTLLLLALISLQRFGWKPAHITEMLTTLRELSRFTRETAFTVVLLATKALILTLKTVILKPIRQFSTDKTNAACFIRLTIFPIQRQLFGMDLRSRTGRQAQAVARVLAETHVFRIVRYWITMPMATVEVSISYRRITAIPLCGLSTACLKAIRARWAAHSAIW